MSSDILIPSLVFAVVFATIALVSSDWAIAVRFRLFIRSYPQSLIALAVALFAVIGYIERGFTGLGQALVAGGIALAFGYGLYLRLQATFSTGSSSGSPDFDVDSDCDFDFD